MKPNYCTRPDVPECYLCSLVNYGLDCANNPIPVALPAVPPSKYQQAYDQLMTYVPSAKAPHLDALDNAGLIDGLAIDQIVAIVKLMQAAYANGQHSQGAEKIDNDAVWLDGVGGIERQPDGKWMLTMPDKPGYLNYLTTEDMASRLGVSVRRVRALAASRQVGWQASRGTWIFRPEDVELLRPGKPGRKSRK